MNQQNINRALSSCLAFCNLNEEEKQQLIKIGKIETIKKGEEVFTIDHEGKKFYVVLEGHLLLRLKSNHTKEYEKGQLFGEVAILGDSLRFGTIRATQLSTLISFDRDCLFNSDSISKELALKITLCLTKKIVSYFNSDGCTPSQKLIEKGECSYVEFKKSMAVGHMEKIVATISAFMNHNGGTIFCGIDDDGEMVGVNFSCKKYDQFQKRMTTKIRGHLGAKYPSSIMYDVEEIDDKTVLRIDCSPATEPVFFKKYDENGRIHESFLVRQGSENRDMSQLSNALTYIQSRFKKKR